MNGDVLTFCHRITYRGKGKQMFIPRKFERIVYHVLL